MISSWQSLRDDGPASADAGLLTIRGDDESSEFLRVFSRRTTLRQSINLMMWVGILARMIRYYLCFPLWDDESFLCVNLIHRSYVELLQPLDYHQVAPVLFLWIERAMVGLLGFSEYSLRLFPFVCSIASLFLFRRVAERLLSGPALLFAVAIFAVSYPGIRYAAEAKPYGTDMFVSLVMLWLVVEWKDCRDIRLIGLLAGLMPVALGMSYPSVFAAGGLSLVMGIVLFTQRGTGREWAAWCVWNLMLVGSFGVWFHVVGRVQGGAEGEFMGEYWKLSFPPISQPWLVPLWLVKTHASDFLAYPVGGPKWASSGTMILCVAGLWRLVQRRQFLWLGLVACPAGLHFIAAALQKYPYGGHVKFSQYLAPMICCLAAVGMVQVLAWFSRRGYSERTGVVLGITVCLVIGGGAIARDLANPYKTRSDFRARAFAQSFWPGVHSAEEVLCMKSDLGLDFIPEQHRELSWSAHYYCNRAIELSRASFKPGDVSLVSATRALRCVMYHDARYPVDQAALNEWVTGMKQKYDLVAHESVPFPRLAKDDRRLITMEYIDSYIFIRPDASANDSTPLANGQDRLHR